MTPTPTNVFGAVSSPEEEEAFQALDRKLNGPYSGTAITSPHLAVTQEEDEAFAAIERAAESAKPTQRTP